MHSFDLAAPRRLIGKPLFFRGLPLCPVSACQIEILPRGKTPLGKPIIKQGKGKPFSSTLGKPFALWVWSGRRLGCVRARFLWPFVFNGFLEVWYTSF